MQQTIELAIFLIIKKLSIYSNYSVEFEYFHTFLKKNLRMEKRLLSVKKCIYCLLVIKI